MIRVKNKFKELKQKKQKAFGVFLTAGYPSLEYSENIFKKILDAEVDFIEIGLPFSDPMADGPLIQHSSQIAIEQNTSVEECLKLVKEIRKINNYIPIILMGYYNPIHYYGNLKFIKKAVSSGIDGLIIVDLPMEEDEEFYNLSYKNNLPLIRLVTPTTDEERLKKILKNACGFVYYVSVTGITGTKSASVNDVKNKIKVIKKITNLPVIAGFGIKKAFNSQGGIKLEAGYRFTNTDYLDDVSDVYYDWENNGGSEAQITMSGTRTGQLWTYEGYALDGNYPDGYTPRPDLGGTNPYEVDYTFTEPGFKRGNPDNDDSYMFLTLSVYKKFTNRTKSYRTISVNRKRKVKASF